MMRRRRRRMLERLTWACLDAAAACWSGEFQLAGSRMQTDTVPEPQTRIPIAGYNCAGQLSFNSASMNCTQTQTRTHCEQKHSIHMCEMSQAPHTGTVWLNACIAVHWLSVAISGGPSSKKIWGFGTRPPRGPVSVSAVESWGGSRNFSKGVKFGALATEVGARLKTGKERGAMPHPFSA